MGRHQRITRRSFLRRSSTAAAATAAPLFLPRDVLGSAATPGANERIVLVIIGMGERGNQMLHNIPPAGRVAAVCDADARRTAACIKRHQADWQGHVQNWLDCIKTRAKPTADVEIGHRTATVCQLLVITRQLGRRLHWDPQGEVFVGDDEANKLLDRPRRDGWKLPDLS